MKFLKISLIIVLFVLSNTLFAQQSSINSQIILKTFPELNDLQRDELLGNMDKINQKLAQNFKTMKLKPLTCKSNIHFSKIYCFSKNYENHLKKEFNHYSGQKIKYGYGFTVILIHQIKPEDILLQTQKPKFLIEQVFWNDTVEKNQYQGNEILTLD